MKTRHMKWLMAIAVGLGLTGAAQAATSDSLTVTITPNAFYAVSINTAAAGGGFLNLGAVSLGASTQTVSPAIVKVDSTYAKTDLTLIGQIWNNGGGTPWTFSSNTALTNETDKLASWAVFTDTSVAVAPTQGVGGAFDGTLPAVSDTDVISASGQDVGDNSTILRRFVLTAATAGYKTMEDIASSAADLAASKANLWLQFRLPAATTDGTNAQKIMLTLTAGAPN